MLEVSLYLQVSYITDRAELLSTSFYLLSFLSFLYHLDTSTSCSGHLYLLLTILLGGVAMLCKEQGVTVLAVCMSYDIIMTCNVRLCWHLPPIRYGYLTIAILGIILDKKFNSKFTCELWALLGSLCLLWWCAHSNIMATHECIIMQRYHRITLQMGRALY